MKIKQCSKCKILKSLMAFYKRTDQSGFRSICKICFLQQCAKRKKHSQYKIVAKNKLRTELLAGRITKPKICESCGQIRPMDAHHYDYSKPLDVLWLCRSCHMRIHNNTYDCNIEGCNKKHFAKGLCSSHYQKQYYLLRKVQ